MTHTPHPLLRREFHPAISIPAEAAQPASPAIIDFVSSDQTLDRFGEIVLASGWRLENYRKNPIVLNAHRQDDLLFTIGRALITEVRGNQLFQRIEFATEINPVARIAYELYRGGFLNAVSVGFLPLRWEDGEPGSGFYRKYLEQELVEVSVAPVPANPNALQHALRLQALQKEVLEESVAALEQLIARDKFCSQTAEPGADTRARGPALDDAHWGLTQLLNQTRALLRRA